MRLRHLAAPICVSVLLALGSCARQQRTGAASRPARLRAVVSILPQAYFVERVGGDRVSVEVLVGPGQSPATYEPSPAQMASLDRADVLFRIGVPFENTLVDRLTASLPGLRVVDTRQGIALRPIDRHQPEAGRAHEASGALDPHIWLDPSLVKVQACTIRGELARLDPEGVDLYERNLEAFEADLERVDRKIAAALAPLRGSEILVFHPAYGYFADAYGLRQVAIEAAGREPGPRRLQQIIERARRTGTRVIFVQPQFSAAGARAIAREIGGAVVPMDPLARDYLTSLEDMADKIAAALKEAPG